MTKRISAVAWSVVILALAVELTIALGTVNAMLHPTPLPPLPTVPTPTFNAPTPTPSGWKQYSSARLGITLFYPDTWEPLAADSQNQTTVEDSFKGPDGFFELGTLSNGNGIDKFCDIQSHALPQFFGAQVSTTREQVANLPACLIQPTDNSPTQPRAQLLLQSPWNDPSYNFITLTTDTDHFKRIVASVLVDPSFKPVATFTPQPVATPLATQLLPTPVYTQSHMSDLTMEQYGIVSSNVDTPNHLEFNLRIPGAVFANRQAIRSPDLSTQLAQANALIGTLGWSFQPISGSPGVFGAFQNGQMASSDLVSLGQVLMDQSNTNFAVVLHDKGGAGWLLQQSGFTTWDIAQHFGVPPVFLGDSLVSLDADPQDPTKIDVNVGGNVVFTDTMTADEVSHPQLTLGVDRNQWVLDANGSLFINGTLSNNRLGFDEIFGWQLLNGKPFYYYTQRGPAGIMYNGLPLAVSFDEVVHNQCCEAAAFNPQGNPRMVWFYARMNGTWYYIELGAFPQ